MGTQLKVTCLDCGEHYEWCDGGGFVFHLLHCEDCGQSRPVHFDELGETHLRYLKGLSGPYAMATADHDRHVQEHYEGEPLSREDYRRAVEDFAGKCNCGGRFRFETEMRCPECRSTNHAQPQMEVLYD